MYVETMTKIDQYAVIAWENLNDVINKILEEIESVNKKVILLKKTSRLKLWWYGKPDFNQNYLNLERYIRLFNKRLDLMLKIIKN